MTVLFIVEDVSRVDLLLMKMVSYLLMWLGWEGCSQWYRGRGRWEWNRLRSLCCQWTCKRWSLGCHWLHLAVAFHCLVMSRRYHVVVRQLSAVILSLLHIFPLHLELAEPYSCYFCSIQSTSTLSALPHHILSQTLILVVQRATYYVGCQVMQVFQQMNKLTKLPKLH